MSTQKSAPSFDDIIQEGRKKKKNEKLAARIFGRGSTPQGQSRARNQSPSLASRIGVQKRPQIPRQSSSQISSIRGNQNRRPKVTPRNSGLANNGGQEISIKGMGSGVFTVIAQNFAPGTTVGDIESVMTPAGEPSVNARLLTSYPTVIAELVYTSRDAALKIVQQFNNKKADGHLLHVYLKGGASNPQPVAAVNPPRAPRSDRVQQQAQKPVVPAEPVYEDNDMEVDQNGGEYYEDTYHEAAPVQPVQPRRAEPSFEDGRYGFGEDSQNVYYEDRTGDSSYNNQTTDKRYDDRNVGARDNVIKNDNNVPRHNNSRSNNARGDGHRGSNYRGDSYRNDSNRNNGQRGGQSAGYRQDNRSNFQRGGRLASDSMIDRR